MNFKYISLLITLSFYLSYSQKKVQNVPNKGEVSTNTPDANRIEFEASKQYNNYHTYNKYHLNLLYHSIHI